MQQNHDHDHAHSHLDEMELRVRALETLLTRKGFVETAALDRIIETYETRVGPHNGAAVVARAWVDPEFHHWLMQDATAAIASMGFGGRQGEHMVAVANTPEQHNMVVCTLCSCYPWPLDPRGVLADFGVHLPQSTQLRVWDSTAEVRYLVIPMMPAEAKGLNQAQLAAWVTRDAMIGTGLAQAPVAAPAHEPAAS